MNVVNLTNEYCQFSFCETNENHLLWRNIEKESVTRKIQIEIILIEKESATREKEISATREKEIYNLMVMQMSQSEFQFHSDYRY